MEERGCAHSTNRRAMKQGTCTRSTRPALLAYAGQVATRIRRGRQRLDVARVLEAAAAILLLILLSPLMIIVSAALVACGRNPLFRQKRIGWRQTEFTILKFQTLAPGRSERPQRTSWLQRIQRLAFAALSRLLRQSRIDELPQLVNIVKGDMAFIGPRPLIPSDVAQMPHGRARRFAVRPGLTGLAQISGGQALTPAEKLLLDVHYIETRSRRLGLWILARTCLVPFEHDQPRAELLRQSSIPFLSPRRPHP
jgi:lipopolysaccharide/colanic/teichoic acid biosynthesis glycosyltransferase